ncbi:hypothetical protein FA15DRAFT_371856 [Coprinopsis marcescibilis]|uniref:Uncharacterized protein n=1 Tax=Coprinopsis marcescibilis TaxID=230819 RepID=A0A5C3KAQ9_COPMA|nr:hypothetical protein FA15DRAFT_371856 [Coprinopsis marcescibilis]
MLETCPLHAVLNSCLTRLATFHPAFFQLPSDSLPDSHSRNPYLASTSLNVGGGSVLNGTRPSQRHDSSVGTLTSPLMTPSSVVEHVPNIRARVPRERQHTLHRTSNCLEIPYPQPCMPSSPPFYMPHPRPSVVSWNSAPLHHALIVCQFTIGCLRITPRARSIREHSGTPTPYLLSPSKACKVFAHTAAIAPSPLFATLEPRQWGRVLQGADDFLAFRSGYSSAENNSAIVAP